MRNSVAPASETATSGISVGDVGDGVVGGDGVSDFGGGVVGDGVDGVGDGSLVAILIVWGAIWLQSGQLGE